MAGLEMEEVTPPVLNPLLQYHAFIAHSSEDREFAFELTEKLEKAKFKCFMYERDLPPDSTIISGVVKNINKSRRVILLMTKNFLESRWSMFEAMEALQKGYNEDQMVLVPVLYQIGIDQVPTYLKLYRCLEYSDEHFWRLLFKALIDERPQTAAIPAGNVAHGLVWSYYYGFLNLVLPGIRERALEWHTTQPEPRREMLTKMVIILPDSCFCPSTLSAVDKDAFEHKGDIPYNATRAGNVKRSYKSPVWKVKDPDSDAEYLFIAEFATPLLSMYEMEDGGLAGLTAEQRLHQRMLFRAKLEDILSHESNQKCLNKATLIDYPDETEEEKRALPRLVCQQIRRELHKDREMQSLKMEELNLQS